MAQAAGRVLALDYGERRIGVAVSDPTRTIAQPLPTIVRRRGQRPPYARIVALVQEWEIELIVVGLPIESSGDEGPQSERVREFAEALARRAGVSLAFWDERLTSARARRELLHLDLPAAARREKARVDAIAAALILQSYLDASSDDRDGD
jgi:putative Holliday junction resolvase